MPTPLLPALLLFFAPPDGTVEVRGDSSWIRPLYPAPKVEVAQGPWVARREITVEVLPGDRVRVTASWELQAHEPGWFTARIAPNRPDLRLERARWDGRAAPVTAESAGLFVTGFVRERSRLSTSWIVEGRVDRGGISLDLSSAVQGEVSVQGLDELEPHVSVEGADVPLVADRFWTGAERLQLTARRPGEHIGGSGQVVVAHTGIGLTVGDAELRGRARVRWEVLRGSLERVELDVAHLGRDLAVEGPNVRSWDRSGDVVRIELQQPTEDVLEVDLRWSESVPSGTESSLGLARVDPRSVFRRDMSLQLARDGEVELIPEVEGASAVAARQLPYWGTGLVEGTPSAAYVGTQASGALDLLRFEPVSGPPVVIDVANYTAATSREGRMLVSGRLEVRNERAAHLKITPPEGMHVLGVRVAGKTALAARDPEHPRTWLVPLERSVESVEGLISFPVEMVLLGDGEEWERRTERDLLLPAFDAPVAASRVTLHLPPGHESKIEEGEHGTVDYFSEGEGIAYGFTAGDVRAEEADKLFQEAVDDWMNNDFEAAQGKLEDLRELGASNENVERLEANLMVIEGQAEGEVDERLARRVKSQAQARAAEDYAEQEAKVSKAKELAAEGKYDEARKEYEKAAEIGEDLAKLEQRESVEQQYANAEVARELEMLEEKEAQSKQIAEYGLRKEKPAKKSGKDLDKKGRWRANRDRNGFGKQRAKAAAASSPVVVDPNEAVNLTAEVDEDELAYALPPADQQAPDVTVYDFEDDDIDGEILSPEGANIASRGRSRDSTVVDLGGMGPGVDKIELGGGGGGDPLGGADGGEAMDGAYYDHADIPEEPMEPEPMPEPEPAPLAAADYDELDVEASSVSVFRRSGRIRGRRGGGGGRARVSRGGKARRKAKRPAGRKTATESTSSADFEVPPERAREQNEGAVEAPPPPAPAGAAAGDAGLDYVGSTTEVEVGDVLVESEEEILLEDESSGELMADEMPRGPAIERLPEPEVTASELNLTVPAIGEVVLYQRLLLPAGEHLRVHVKTRAPRKRHRR